MADKEGKFLECYKVLIKKLEPLSKLSLEEKLKNLQNFQKRKKDMEEELKYIDIAITYLNYMSDLARYTVTKSDLALSLLSELKNKKDVKYSELRSSFPSDSLYGTILDYHLDLLNRAKLIEKIPLSKSADYYINIIGDLEKP